MPLLFFHSTVICRGVKADAGRVSDMVSFLSPHIRVSHSGGPYPNRMDLPSRDQLYLKNADGSGSVTTPLPVRGEAYVFVQARHSDSARWLPGAVKPCQLQRHYVLSGDVLYFGRVDRAVFSVSSGKTPSGRGSRTVRVSRRK